MAPPQASPPQTEVRPRAQLPIPALADVAPCLRDLRRPALRAPRQMARRAPRPPQRRIGRRQRRLTGPVRGAMGVRLGWWRRPAVAEGQQGLARAGGDAPVGVRAHARTNRRDGRPAAGMGERCTAGGASSDRLCHPWTPDSGPTILCVYQVPETCGAMAHRQATPARAIATTP
jgi:hypothetical protein